MCAYISLSNVYIISHLLYSPEAQWDATPLGAKWQIFAVISVLELWDECGGGGTVPHYMSGRKPGQYPTFQLFRDNVHFVLDLYDPFGFSKKMSEEKKEKRLVMEINNGRLAMIGILIKNKKLTKSNS